MQRMFVISLASVFLFLVAIVFRSSRWKTICTASGDLAEELRERHAFLEAQGLRCRLRAEDHHADEGPAGTVSGMTAVMAITVTLQVHEDDIKPAADALARYARSWLADGSRAL